MAPTQPHSGPVFLAAPRERSHPPQVMETSRRTGRSFLPGGRGWVMGCVVQEQGPQRSKPTPPAPGELPRSAQAGAMRHWGLGCVGPRCHGDADSKTAADSGAMWCPPPPSALGGGAKGCTQPTRLPPESQGPSAQALSAGGGCGQAPPARLACPTHASIHPTIPLPICQSVHPSIHPSHTY